MSRRSSKTKHPPKQIASSHRVEKSFSYKQDDHPFVIRFNNQCTIHNCKETPKTAQVLVKEPYSVSAYKNTVIFCLNSDEDILDLVYVKGWDQDLDVFLALSGCIESFNITVLKLEFCGLKETHLKLLEAALRENNFLKELNLNGNPMPEQNYHLLLFDTSILKISLRFCQINVEGAKNLSKILCKTTKTKLMHLNLSSNDLGDEGMFFIGKILRANRILVSLNLADNKVCDEGCEVLVDCFKVFSLTHEEIVKKRRIKFMLLKAVPVDVDQSSILGKVASGKFTRKSSKTSASSRGLLTILMGRERFITVNFRSVVEKNSQHSGVSSNKQTSTILVQDSIFNHPFICDSWEENKNIYCKGNNALKLLNLSYNSLTIKSLILINGMINYQKTAFLSNAISMILLQGNNYDENCSLMQEINENLDLNHAKSSEFSLKRKRPSTSSSHGQK